MGSRPVEEAGDFGERTLRLIRGNLALCDYRELVKPELGDLNQTLWDADTDGNLRVPRPYEVCQG